MRWLQALKAMAALNKDPADREAQLRFVMALDQGALERRLAWFRSSEQGRALLATRPSLDARHLSRARLLTLPEGSVGREVARFLDAWAIAPFAPPASAPRSELEWIARWIADTHDCFHVALGFGGDPLGEIELQAFMWARWRQPTALIVMFFGVFMSCRKSSPLTVWRRLRAAYRLGRAARPLDDLPWLELLEAPLASIREQAGLSHAG